MGAALVATLLLPGAASGATLTVGPGKAYATPCAAIGAAAPGDTVLVSPGASAYTDSCAIGVAGLTVRGVDGQPTIDLSGMVPLPNKKGIYDVTADDVTLDNLELTGASVGDSAAGFGANGAGIRDEASGLVVLYCYIHDNQDGILATPANPGSTLTVEYTQLDHNALGDGCSGPGCTHNIYVGSNNIETFLFAFNWSHNAGDGNASGNGHLLKTRAQNNYILYNALLGEAGTESYELDIPQGGFSVVVGNVLEKSPTAGNPVLFTYAEEGPSNTSSDVYVVNNTFVSDYTMGEVTFIKVATGSLAAHNDLFSGMGTPSTTGTLSADNLSPSAPLFVSPSTYDYHLQAGSPAIGHAVAPGSAGAFSLTPTFEYVQPLESARRTTVADVGAFEYGTNLAGAGQSDAVTVSDGGAVTTADAGMSVGRSDGGSGTSSGTSTSAATTTSGFRPDAGRGESSGAAAGEDAGTGAATSSGGCGCVLACARARSRVGLLALGLLCAASHWRRRRRRP